MEMKQIRNTKKFANELKEGELEVGWYKLGKYSIMVGMKGGDSTTSNARVRAFYHRNKDKIRQYKKELYHERKNKGLCPKCGKRANHPRAKKTYTMCKNCRLRSKTYKR